MGNGQHAVFCVLHGEQRRSPGKLGATGTQNQRSHFDLKQTDSMQCFVFCWRTAAKPGDVGFALRLERIVCLRYRTPLLPAIIN